MRISPQASSRFFVVAALTLLCGCGRQAPGPESQSDGPNVAAEPVIADSDTGQADQPPALPSITLALDGEASRPQQTSRGPDELQHQRELIDAMKPLQVMLGSWKGTTQREFGDFKALDQPEWVWDFQTDPGQPEMVMTSQASPYFRQMRLTYLTDQDRYRLKITDPEGQTRTLDGTFSQPVEEFQGDDKRLHRRYKLELAETAPADPKDAWQLVFNQQENNRYLVELSRQRGQRFMRFDTVATQREGTSFAINDADYGEKACIITGGLGTSTVSHKGKTYWVCCSGCRAAFEDDPEKWIAAAAELKSP